MTSALDGIPVTVMPGAGHYGPKGMDGVRLRLFDMGGIATLAARRGAAAALAEAAKASLGIDLPEGSGTATANGITAIGTAPGHWLLVAREGDLVERLAPLGPHATTTGQTDGYAAFEVSGARVRDLLAKGVTVDLDPSVFPVGAGATTNVAHLNVTFWREGEETYVFLVGRSFAVALARFFLSSGAEYGLSFSRG